MIKGFKTLMYLLLVGIILVSQLGRITVMADDSKPTATCPWAGAVTTSSGGLNVRSGPGTSYSIITYLDNHDTVQVVGQSGSWYKVKANGKTGYVSKSYMVIISRSSGKVVLTSGTLNLRATSSGSSKIIKSIPNGAVVTFLESIPENYYNVVYQNYVGWVHIKYVKPVY